MRASAAPVLNQTQREVVLREMAAIGGLFWLKTSLRSLPVSNEPLQLGFLFFICAPRVSRHNYSGRPSQNGHGLQFSFSNNSAGNRGEGSREKNPKPQKRMKTRPSPISKMKKNQNRQVTVHNALLIQSSPLLWAGCRREDTLGRREV